MQKKGISRLDVQSAVCFWAEKGPLVHHSLPAHRHGGPGHCLLCHWRYVSKPPHSKELPSPFFHRSGICIVSFCLQKASQAYSGNFDYSGNFCEEIAAFDRLLISRLCGFQGRACMLCGRFCAASPAHPLACQPGLLSLLLSSSFSPRWATLSQSQVPNGRLSQKNPHLQCSFDLSVYSRLV